MLTTLTWRIKNRRYIQSHLKDDTQIETFGLRLKAVGLNLKFVF